MRAAVKHLKYRLLAGLALALTGNSSAAVTASQRAILNFKPTSPVIRPQTMRTQQNDLGVLDNNFVIVRPRAPVAPVTTTPVNTTPTVTSPAVTVPVAVVPVQGAVTPPPPVPVQWPKGQIPPTNVPPISLPTAPAAPAVTSAPTVSPSDSITPTMTPAIRGRIPSPRARPSDSEIAEADNQLHAVAPAPHTDGKCPYPDGRCYKSLHAAGLGEDSKIDTGKVVGSEMSCGQRKLLEGAKSNVARVFGNRPRSHGQCGAGVGSNILRAGFPFDTSGRNAINYVNILDRRGWTKTSARSVAEAPPGSVLIFSGPCTPGYPHPEGTFGCGSGAGNRVGHVTIKGDAKSDGRQYYYTDGRTEDPAIRHRYFVAAYIPGPSQNALCGGN